MDTYVPAVKIPGAILCTNPLFKRVTTEKFLACLFYASSPGYTTFTTYHDAFFQHQLSRGYG